MNTTSSRLVEISLYGTLFNFKPIGKELILSIGNDHDLSVWNVRTGECIQKHKGGTNALSDASYKEPYYTYCSNDGLVFLASSQSSIVTQINIRELLENSEVVPLSVVFVEDLIVVGTTSAHLMTFQYGEQILKLQQIFKIADNPNPNAWPTALQCVGSTLIVHQLGIFQIYRQKDGMFTYEQEYMFGDSQILCYDVYKKNQEQHLISNYERSFMILGDASGKVWLFVTLNLKDFVLFKEMQASSAVLQVQVFEVQGQVSFAFGTLDPSITVFGLDSGSGCVPNRAAPFYFYDDGKKLIARSDKVTRLAYIEELGDLFA